MLQIFVNVLLPAILAAGAVIAAALFSSAAQMKAAAFQTFLQTRLEAYKDFEAAMDHWSIKESPETYSALYHAANVAALVASRETIAMMGKLLKIIRQHQVDNVPIDTKELSEMHLLTIKAMHDDLLTYPKPKAVRAWGKKSIEPRPDRQ